MVSHRRNRRMRAAGIRGLLLNYRDIVVLAICAAGLLAAWLVYGVTGSGNHGTPAAGEPAATVLSGQVPDPLVRAAGRPRAAGAGTGVPSPDPAALARCAAGRRRRGRCAAGRFLPGGVGAAKDYVPGGRNGRAGASPGARFP